MGMMGVELNLRVRESSLCDSESAREAAKVARADQLRVPCPPALKERLVARLDDDFMYDQQLFDVEKWRTHQDVSNDSYDMMIESQKHVDPAS